MRLFLLAALLIPSVCLASMKVFVQPTYTKHAKDVSPLVGASLWQKIPVVPVGLNLFAGSGDNFTFNDETVHWRTARGALDFLGDGWTISPGYQYVYDNVSKQSQDRYFVRFSMTVWE